MGIYPERDVKVVPAREGKKEKVVITTTEPGLETIKRYTLTSTITNRTDCFCCSCGDWGADAACRNHGFAAQRPCEEHGMPGSTWDEEMEPELEGIMPDSVQEVRRQEAARAQ